jgi:hypothetical protein
MQQSPSWGANTSAVIKKFCTFLWNRQINRSVHNGLQPVPALSQIHLPHHPHVCLFYFITGACGGAVSWETELPVRRSRVPFRWWPNPSGRNLSKGGKGRRWVGLTTLPPSSVGFLEIWGPQPPGTFRASPVNPLYNNQAICSAL